MLSPSIMSLDCAWGAKLAGKPTIKSQLTIKLYNVLRAAVSMMAKRCDLLLSAAFDVPVSMGPSIRVICPWRSLKSD